MRKVILTIVAVLTTSLCLSQGLSKEAVELRRVAPEQYYKIELLVSQYDKKTDPIFNILVNSHVKARAKVDKYIGTLETRTQLNKFKQYIELSREEVRGVEVFNWILLAKFVGV